MPILIDASVFCALANKRDVHHLKSTKIMQEIIQQKYGTALTTDYIFDEILAVIARRTNRTTSREFGNTLLHSELLLTFIDQTLFRKSWELFQKHELFSFTDCTNLSFMETFNIQKIATFDKEFKKVPSIEVIDF